jgi:hypothetical protein
VSAQFGCLNFHAKCYKDWVPKLSLTVKNKWSLGRIKAWYYCRVPARWSSEGGKSVFALRSYMSVLGYQVEPLVYIPDTNSNDVAFVQAVKMIRGHDVVEEFLACGLYPLSASFSFDEVSDGTTAMSKVVVPLPVFPYDPDCIRKHLSIFGEGGNGR